MFGQASTFRAFPDEFRDCTDHAAYQRLIQWSRDRRTGKVVGDSRRQSILGNTFEAKIVEQIETRREAGLCIDDDILRTLIFTQLVKEERTVTVTGSGVVTVSAPVTVNAPALPPSVLHRAAVLKMKVSELRSTLVARGMNPNGQKTELIFRLVDAYNL